MQDCMNTVSDFGNVREAVCISTQKIMDACRDQDCMEDLTVYLTQESQETLECATSVKARSAELLYAEVGVEPINYQDDYYCVSVQYYYRIIADAVLCAVRPAAIYGLATFNKRVTLFGGDEGARVFTSTGATVSGELPEAVVEAIDPVILRARIQEVCQCHRPACSCQGTSLPQPVAEAFDDELVLSGQNRILTVTLGQFSLIRLERQTQLLIPSYDYCMPEKACSDQGCGVPENPCEAFSRMQFPVQAFFPQSDRERVCGRNTGCGCQRRCACQTEENRESREARGTCENREEIRCGEDRPKPPALPSPGNGRNRGCGGRQNS